MQKEKSLKKNHELLLLCLPAMALLLILNYAPMAGLVIAFKNFRYDLGLWGSEWVGLKNFEFFFLSQDAWRITRNTLGYNAMFIVSNLFFSVLFALFLNEVTKRKYIKGYQTIMFIPYFLSWVVVGYMLYAFIDGKLGIVNNLFEQLGLAPVQWYGKAKYWPFIIFIVNIWKNVGYYSVIFYAGILGIDSEVYEAAKIDGASRLQVVTKITVPLLTPLMTILTLLAIGKIFYADFGLFYHLPRETGILFSTTDVIDTYVFRSLKKVGDLGMATAAGLFQSVCGFILVMLSNYIVGKVNSENKLY